MSPPPRVGVFFSDEEEIVEPLRWFRENHILWYTRKIDEIKNPIEFIKDIAKAAIVDVQELFDEPVGKGDWLNANFSKIKTPIFRRKNVNVSPGSDDPEDFAHIGFDKNALSIKLKLNK